MAAGIVSPTLYDLRATLIVLYGHLKLSWFGMDITFADEFSAGEIFGLVQILVFC
jgi:hypothetical protein